MREKFIEEIFISAQAEGVEEIEVHMTSRTILEINVFQKEVEKYAISSEDNLAVRGIYKGKMGYSYTEKLEEASIEELLNNLKGYALANTREELEKISDPHKIDARPQKKNGLLELSEEEKITFLLDLERLTYERDARIKTVSNCSYKEFIEKVEIRNTKGLELASSSSLALISLGVVTEEAGSMETGFGHRIITSLDESLKDYLIDQAAGDALAMLGAGPLAPARMEVILRNQVAADLLAGFVPIFLASQVQNKLSLLEGKQGTKIAMEGINIIEDPLMEGGKVYRSFDDEASPTRRKYLVKDGTLETFLYNNATASRDGVESTGNGFRASHKSSVGVEATNIYLEPGSKSLEELIKTMDRGLVITEIHGLHAGINPVSGDFSLSSNGLLVEKGEIVRPVSKITMAGNLFKLLMEVREIGSDLGFSHPSGPFFGSPSLYVGELDISGK
ncbi:MAG: TldD/PmbA family protein [Tissierellia bacterium]|nr:TldD/PmbA family protein [Tissierellia bacterium]